MCDARASDDSAPQQGEESATLAAGAEKVETIWVEKRITPATQWIENLVQPITSWAEQKIQLRDKNSESNAAPVPQFDAENVDATGLNLEELIEVDEAIQAATSAIKGEVLRVKLIEKQTLQYRVKIISEWGVIHLVYVDAYTGKLDPMSQSAKEE